MRQIDIVRVLVLSVGLLVITGSSQTTKKHQQEPKDVIASDASSCNDSIKNCKKPVKYVSEEHGCYTFACEHGTSNEHLIKMNEKAKIKGLMDLAGEKASKMDKQKDDKTK